VIVGGTSLLNEARGNAYAAGFIVGLGVDVAKLSRVFVRGGWEYAYFSPAGRVAIGVRF